MKYNVILADPPVPFEVWGKRPGGTDSRSAEAHYNTMSWDELNALDLDQVAADDCCLFLWMCQPLLYLGLHSLHVLKVLHQDGY